MSEFAEVEREEIAVQFVRVPDGLEHIRRAWDELEAVVELRGRHFYGAFDPVANDYRACVEVRRETSPCRVSRRDAARRALSPRAAARRAAGGLRADRADVRRAHPEGEAGPSRPSLEHYRRRDEIDLLLPI